jgi:hypothetical protein
LLVSIKFPASVVKTLSAAFVTSPTRPIPLLGEAEREPFVRPVCGADPHAALRRSTSQEPSNWCFTIRALAQAYNADIDNRREFILNFSPQQVAIAAKDGFLLTAFSNKTPHTFFQH